MAPRALLQSLLEVICDNVYFQPPPDVQMIYPAIVYERGRAETQRADNVAYLVDKRYQVTIISRSPDESMFDTISALPLCTHERFYVADNLNHDVFNIYF